MKNAVSIGLAALFCAGATCAQVVKNAEAKVEKKKIYSNSYLGKTPPELTSRKEDWLNAKRPIELKKLAGRVVWLEFSFIH